MVTKGQLLSLLTEIDIPGLSIEEDKQRNKCFLMKDGKAVVEDPVNKNTMWHILFTLYMLFPKR
ncbi:hypothetical protein J7L85_00550 [candidate division WOR-3 bacterium]|nr:hypothetical protein [candidate division WOR-3 bacterium]